jgi:hypothetical protein
MAGDFNFYRYVGNDPVNFVDPSGLMSVSILKLISNVTVLAVISTAMSLSMREPMELDSSSEACSGSDGLVVEGSTDDPSETELEIIKPESEMEGEELPTIPPIPPLTPVISQVKILDGPESVPKFPEPYSSVANAIEARISENKPICAPCDRE